jgi:hypothetical protein
MAFNLCASYRYCGATCEMPWKGRNFNRSKALISWVLSNHEPWPSRKFRIQMLKQAMLA